MGLHLGFPVLAIDSFSKLAAEAGVCAHKKSAQTPCGAAGKLLAWPTVSAMPAHIHRSFSAGTYCR
jgi:hypothetical protein